MTSSNRRALPLGTFRPASHASTVFFDTPSTRANTAWETLSSARRFFTTSASHSGGGERRRGLRAGEDAAYRRCGFRSVPRTLEPKRKIAATTCRPRANRSVRLRGGRSPGRERARWSLSSGSRSCVTGFRQFLRRGPEKVSLERDLVRIADNLGRLKRSSGAQVRENGAVYLPAGVRQRDGKAARTPAFPVRVPKPALRGPPRLTSPMEVRETPRRRDPDDAGLAKAGFRSCSRPRSLRFGGPRERSRGSGRRGLPISAEQGLWREVPASMFRPGTSPT